MERNDWINEMDEKASFSLVEIKLVFDQSPQINFAFLTEAGAWAITNQIPTLFSMQQ